MSFALGDSHSTVRNSSFLQTQVALASIDESLASAVMKIASPRPQAPEDEAALRIQKAYRGMRGRQVAIFIYFPLSCF